MELDQSCGCYRWDDTFYKHGTVGSGKMKCISMAQLYI